MNAKEQLAEIRKTIDEIDGQMLPLFERRMLIAEQVAKIKQENNLAIFDESREQVVIERATEGAREDLRGEVSLLMRSIMALSRERQRKLLFQGDTPLFPPPQKRKCGSIVCAFQGVAGAWSEQALIKIFPDAEKVAMEYFEDVFLAVKDGKADYGVVPIENSQSGAIGENYDLLRKYGCFIVDRVWVDCAQCLLASEGVQLSDIRNVYSHPEGFKQCSRFLKKHAWDLNTCRNTAVAAQTVAQANDGKSAAIGSRRAAEVNGLTVLAPDITDMSGNRTSFVVIALNPEYDEQSDVISITFSTAHRSGALCETLLPFMAQGLNLIRLESRPADAGSYRFFADLQGGILDPNTVFALRQAASASGYFEVIGCYKGRP